jgi:hypothetical protein
MIKSEIEEAKQQVEHFSKAKVILIESDLWTLKIYYYFLHDLHGEKSRKKKIENINFKRQM